MKVVIPIKLPSLTNQRLNWKGLARQKKDQRYATGLCLYGHSIPRPPWTVTITRVGPRKLDDDNLAAACKAVRDEIAAFVGVDDGSDLYSWVYRQRKGVYSVEVEITSADRELPSEAPVASCAGSGRTPGRRCVPELPRP